MKKVLLYIMFAAVGLGLQSCLHDDNEVFSQSAAERIDAVVNETSALLESAEYGWAFNYYMGQEYAYGSFVMTAQFKNGKVTLKQQGNMDVDGYVAQTSTYKMTRDQGPILSFDTYNDILHAYGDPSLGSPTDVSGYEADFEFVIMGISEDQNVITLKGKKFGNYMSLVRLEKPSDDYLAAVDNVAENMGSFAAMKYDDGTTTAKFYYGASAYTLKYTDEDGEEVSQLIPFTFTDSGVLFNEPITLGDNIIAGINYLDGQETLPLIDTKDQSITVSYDPVDVFVAGNWYIAASNLGEVAAAGFKSFTDACAKNEGEDVDYCYIGTYRSGGFGFCFMSGGRYIGLESFDVVTEGEDIITFSFGGSVGNGGWYRSNDNLADATTPFYSTFKLTTDDAKNPTYFILSDVNNEKNVIKLVKEVITYPAYK